MTLKENTWPRVALTPQIPHPCANLLHVAIIYTADTIITYSVPTSLEHTLRLYRKNLRFNAVYGNNRCLFSYSYETHMRFAEKI
jgi:hypothetical protein